MRVDSDDDNEAVTVKPGDDCFYCGKPLLQVRVVWQGNDKNGTQIGLHSGCAERLSVHLHSDAQRRH